MGWIALVGVVAGCGGAPAPAPASPAPASPASRTAASAALAAAADRAWRRTLRENPTMATQLGVPGYDDRLPDPSIGHAEAAVREARALLAEVEAIDESALSPSERITRAMLVRELRGEVEGAVCRGERWIVDHLWGPQVWFLNLGTQTRLRTPGDERNYLARIDKMPAYLDAKIAALRAGLAEGLVAPRLNVERALRQLDELADTPPESWPLVAAADQVPEARRAALRSAIAARVAGAVAPAFARYRAFLADELLPAARTAVGVGALPGGGDCYRAAIRRHTSLDVDPQTLHELGLREMKRIRAEMRALAAGLFPGVPLEDVLARLRDDPAYGFSTRDEVEAAAVAAVDRARAALPRAFSRLPRAPVEVKRLEPHAEKDAPMAYYRNPSADGEQPGTYFVNTYLPRQRPRYTAEVLAFHEAVPGHHLQVALAMELEGVPEFQKHAGTTAFVEGWALYAERLADELGLYSGPLDRLGMLSFDAWRAARLVVDTGIHALGWSRQRAIDYMVANTASTLPDIENEVDRYITWPGQALAYKVGQLEIVRLRRRAQQALGDRFDLRAFHDRVLRNGAVPLDVLAGEIDDWIRDAAR